jgi:hypothetical protein
MFIGPNPVMIDPSSTFVIAAVATVGLVCTAFPGKIPRRPVAAENACVRNSWQDSFGTAIGFVQTNDCWPDYGLAVFLTILCTADFHSQTIPKVNRNSASRCPYG